MDSYEKTIEDKDIPDNEIKIIDFKGEGNFEDAKKILEEGDWLTVYNSQLYLHFKFSNPKTITSITTFCGNKKASMKDLKFSFLNDNQIFYSLNYKRSNEDIVKIKTKINDKGNENGIICSEIILEVTSNYGEYYTGFNRIHFHEETVILDYNFKKDCKNIVVKDKGMKQYAFDSPIKSRFITVDMQELNGGYYIGLNRMYFLDKNKEKIKNQNVVKFNGNYIDDLKIITSDAEKGGWLAQCGDNQKFLVDLGTEQEVKYIELYFANQENRPKFVKINKLDSQNIIKELEDFFIQCIKYNAKLGIKVYKLLLKELPYLDNIDNFINTSFYEYLISPILKGNSFKFPINTKKDYNELLQIQWFQTNWKFIQNNLVSAPDIYDHHGITKEMLNQPLKTCSKIMTISAKSEFEEYFSTGLFLYPNQQMKIILKEGDSKGWNIRIGCQTDIIGIDEEKLLRFPSISIVEKIENEMTIISPYGGLVLIESNGIKNCKSEIITVEISGAVESPLFNSETKNFDLKEFNSPWVELEGKYVHLSIPIRSFKNVTDKNILESLLIWDKVYKSHSELLRPVCPYRKERIVPDTQISCGYMHSGYPIMTHYDICEYNENEKKLPVIFGLNPGDNWGLLHELGHNFQRDYWCFEGTIEVTVNLFTIYSFYNVFQIDINKGHPALEEYKTKAKEYLKIPNFEKWKEDPFLALTMYIQILEKHGFDPLKKCLLEYELEIEKGIKPPTSNKDIIEIFIRKLSLHCGVDLRKHFTSWAIPHSNFKDERLNKLKPFIYNYN